MTQRILFIFFLFAMQKAYSQTPILTIQQGVSTALKNNPGILSSNLEIDQQRILGNTYRDFGKTNIGLQYGQSNSIKADSYFSIEQPIPNPSLFKNQKAYYAERTKGSQLNLAITQNELLYQVKTVYYQLSYYEAARKLLLAQDTLFAGFLRASELRFKAGETNLLEKTTAETQLNEIRNRVQQNETDILIARNQLATYLNSAVSPTMLIDTLNKLSITVEMMDSIQNKNPELAYLQQQIKIADKVIGVEKARGKPDFSISYFNQSIIGTQEVKGVTRSFNAGHRFQGGAIGMSIPIFYKPYAARIKAAKVDKQIAETKYQLFLLNLKGQYQQALQDYMKDTRSISYYEKSALINGDLILRQAQIGFKNGEIGYVEFLQALKTSRDIRSEYLNAINDLNQSVLRIQYLSGLNQ